MVDEALATVQDVEVALGRALTETEQQRVAGLLLEASDLVAGYLHPNSVPSPTPPPIRRVVAAMVSAALTRPSTIPQDAVRLGADIYSVEFAPGATGPGQYLTAAMKARLAPYRTGAVSQLLGSERF